MQKIKSMAVLVPISELGVRKLNKWLEEGWLYADGFQTETVMMAILEKPTRTDMDDWNEPLEEEEEDRDW